MSHAVGHRVPSGRTRPETKRTSIGTLSGTLAQSSPRWRASARGAFTSQPWASACRRYLLTVVLFNLVNLATCRTLAQQPRPFRFMQRM